MTSYKRKSAWEKGDKFGVMFLLGTCDTLGLDVIW